MPELDLFHLQARNFFFQFHVFSASVMKVDVIVPGVAEEASSGNKRAFERRKSGNTPDANEAGAASGVGSARVFRTLDLSRQGDDLNEQDRHQDERVLVPAEKVFHARFRRV